MEEPTPSRRAGQDFANSGQQFVTPVHAGHKADAGSYLRSKKKTYLRKISSQRSKKGK